MFGYVMVNKPELKVRELDEYQAYYCGLCHMLKKQHGRAGQATLSFDMTFLTVLLTGLYEPEEQSQCSRCITHPLVKHQMVTNKYSSYAADMNLLLSYYNLLDNWKDDHNYKSRILAGLLSRRRKKTAARYPRQHQAILHYLQDLSTCEQEHAQDLDLAAGLTGTMLGEIFACEEDAWAPYLRRLGFFLGKFIYLMDAVEDLEEDRESGSYNPWLPFYEQEDFKSYSRQILTMMMGECSLAFEQLPILKNAGILRNILYSGVWSKYEQIKEKQKHV